MPTILVEPLGLRIECCKGEILLEALRASGVDLATECGGSGVCAKCLVRIGTSGSFSPPTRAEIRGLGAQRLSLGYRLACQMEVLGAGVIELVSGNAPNSRQILTTDQAAAVSSDPPVRKYHVDVTSPDLSDVRSDLRRLIDALPPRLSEVTAPLEVVSDLPDLARQARWNLSVVVRDGVEIVGLEAGDTTDRCFGVALDVGTSKIVAYLCDLGSGRVLATEALENPQLPYGEDVVHRLSFAQRSSEDRRLLQQLVVDRINDLVGLLCDTAGVSCQTVYEITAVGNTAMHHLLLGIGTRYLGLSPYVAASNLALQVPAAALGLAVHPLARVYAPAVVAGFVGSDCLSVVLATRLSESTGLSLAMDLGTNTEIALADGESITTCSCASGPAFEGYHVKYGMKAATGAIQSAVYDPQEDRWQLGVVGGGRAAGICGSGIIDVVAELLRHGIIGARGRFDPAYSSSRLRWGDQGHEFLLVPAEESLRGADIVVTEKDVGEIQLAKAAVYSGAALLLRSAGKNPPDVDCLYVAGAFGNYLNLENAKRIGMLPDVPSDRIHFVGNAAGAGARYVLISRSQRREAERLADRIGYLELVVDKDFRETWTKALKFPE